MSFLDRIIGFIMALLGAVTALLLFLVALGWDAVPNVLNVLSTMASRSWETGLSAIVLLMASLHLLFSTLPRRNEPAMVRETTLGQVRIALRAIENSVYRSARMIKGVRDVEARVIPNATGVDIRICLAIAPDMVIPDLVNEVQQDVERYIQETVGIPVSTINVEVKSVTGESKARVE